MASNKTYPTILRLLSDFTATRNRIEIPDEFFSEIKEVLADNEINPNAIEWDYDPINLPLIYPKFKSTDEYRQIRELKNQLMDLNNLLPKKEDTMLDPKKTIEETTETIKQWLIAQTLRESRGKINALGDALGDDLERAKVLNDSYVVLDNISASTTLSSLISVDEPLVLLAMIILIMEQQGQNLEKILGELSDENWPKFISMFNQAAEKWN